MRYKAVGVGGIVLAAVIAPIMIGCGGKEERETTTTVIHQTAANLPTTTVEERTVPEWLEATGAVKPQLEAVLSAKVMSRVATVAVREGDRVRKGQTLITLEANDLGAAVDVARAGMAAATAGFTNSKTVAEMEASMSEARIQQAQAALKQAEAGLMSARARLDLAKAGPRRQEKAQAALAVRQAETNLNLATTEYRRMEALHKEGAVATRQLDSARTQYEIAKAQLDTAKEALSIAEEGTRAEDLRAAEESVRQAEATVSVARAAVTEAKAAALQAKVRRQEVNAAKAQVGQSAASLRMAQTTRGYASIQAPFDGIVVARTADPGTMAGMGAPLLTIQGGPLRLEAVVPENNITKIKVGNPVSVVLDALNHDVEGKVVEIRPYGDASTHTFLVRVEVPNQPGIVGGMFGRARFEIGVKKQILVPKTAVWNKDGMDLVYVVRDGNPEMRIVMLGDQRGPDVQVQSGLAVGDQVVTDYKAVGK